MLVLSRKTNEVVRIGDDIRITVTRIEGGKVTLGFDCPKDVAVFRGELGGFVAKMNPPVAELVDAGRRSCENSRDLCCE